MELVIIGGGATGLKAAVRARRRNEDAKITVLDSGRYVSLSKCGLPYYIGGLVNELDDLRKTTYNVVRNEEYFKKLFNIDVLTETIAKRIDRERKRVIIEKEGKEDEINYDFLVIATGSKAKKIPNIEADGITTLSSPDDAEKILDMWMDEKLNKAVIIGGRLKGIEAAEALKLLDAEVTIIEPTQLLPELDRDMATLVQKYLAEKGIRVITNASVKEIITDGSVRAVKTDKEEIPADLVVLAIGVEPNVDLAKDCGLEIGESGAIKVNEYLRTSDKFIFAGGDCVETINLITGKPVYSPSGDLANKHGRIIGDNITGGKSKFPGIIGTTIAKAFDVTIAKTGLTEGEAKKYYDAVSVVASMLDREYYYPRFGNIRFKLIFDRKTLRILGAQCVGSGVVDKRIDVVATAIQAKMTINDLANLDLAYSPPYSPALDPAITIAHVARNLYDGLFNTVSTEYVKKKLNSDETVIIDLREKGEGLTKIEASNVMNIPLSELRERLNEIPKDKEIITICPVGLRSYVGARILMNMGFKNVKATAGGLAFW